MVSPRGLAKNPLDKVSLSLLVNVESLELSTILKVYVVLLRLLLTLPLL